MTTRDRQLEKIARFMAQERARRAFNLVPSLASTTVTNTDTVWRLFLADAELALQAITTFKGGIDVNELDDEVRESIINNALGDAPTENEIDTAFQHMSIAEAFDAYCKWHGIIGYAEQLINALDNIRSAAK